MFWGSAWGSTILRHRPAEMRSFLSFLYVFLSRCLSPSSTNCGPRYTDRLWGQPSPVSGGTEGEAPGTWSWFLPLKFTVWGSAPPLSSVPSLYVASLSTGTAWPYPSIFWLSVAFHLYSVCQTCCCVNTAETNSCLPAMQSCIASESRCIFSRSPLWGPFLILIFVRVCFKRAIDFFFVCFYWRCDYLWFRWMLAAAAAAAAFSLTPSFV